MKDKVEHSDEEWQALLSPEQFRVLRQEGTEPPFTGTLLDNHECGLYLCAACGNPLFRSIAKYDSGSGWPSFYEPVGPEAVETRVDGKLGMVRTEVRCGRCGSHLGHVFDDGPRPTGQRYCMNSVALSFEREPDDVCER